MPSNSQLTNVLSLQSTNRFEDKIGIVTGGNSGIGEGAARAFAREGAKVILMARNEEKGRAVETAIRSDGGEPTFIGCDVTDEGAVNTAVQEAAVTYGAIHFLFNNAGRGAPSQFPNEPLEDFEHIVRVNLTSTFNMSQAVWPHLIKAGGGAVINMSSVAAQRGINTLMYEEFGATTPAYWASKAGVEALTRYLAGIGGKHHIRVNCVRPGQILTSRATRGTLHDPDGGHHVFEKWFEKTQVLEGPGLPEDVANLVLFLASDESRFITSEMINVDGGIVGKI